MSDLEIVESDDDGNEDLEKTLKDIQAQLSDVTKKIRALEGRKRFLERRKNELTEKIQDKETEKVKGENWGRKNFDWSDRLDAALVGVFGLSSYRPDQLAVINASMSGHDVLLIMPTGGGKSLTYQLPALVSKGLTLVVTPLLSLMEDQLFALRKLGVNAASLSSSTDKEEKSRVLKELSDSNSELKLLYVTPEKCAKSKQFMTKLQKVYQAGRLSRIAIDEVHCCSQWGHDFRPDYKFLGAMKGMFPEVPVLGLTATSTANVTKDVKEILRIPAALVFMAGFNRPNLHYSVRLKPEVATENFDNLANIIENEFSNESGIIYTTTIKEVETLTHELKRRGIAAGSYHAQMDPSNRSKVHLNWLNERVKVVVATVAFGMGIDKPDVRFVIHNTLSKSMENFYQESGRAGRDGKPAKCILQFRLGDVFKQSTMVFTEQTGCQKLYSMVSYCLNVETCRRNIIAEHFLESWEPVPCNRMCDVCEGSTSGSTQDISGFGQAAVKILREAKRKEVRVTGLKLVDALLGKGAKEVKIDGWKTGLGRDKVELIVAYLIVEGFLREDFHFTPYSTISYLVEGGREVRKIEIKIQKSKPNEPKLAKNNSQAKLAKPPKKDFNPSKESSGTGVPSAEQDLKTLSEEKQKSDSGQKESRKKAHEPDSVKKASRKKKVASDSNETESGKKKLDSNSGEKKSSKKKHESDSDSEDFQNRAKKSRNAIVINDSDSDF